METKGKSSEKVGSSKVTNALGQIHGMTHSSAGAILKDKEQTMQSENLQV